MNNDAKGCLKGILYSMLAIALIAVVSFGFFSFREKHSGSSKDEKASIDNSATQEIEESSDYISEYKKGFADGFARSADIVSDDLDELWSENGSPLDDIDFLSYYYFDGGSDEYTADDAEAAMNRIYTFIEDFHSYSSDFKEIIYSEAEEGEP